MTALIASTEAAGRRRGRHRRPSVIARVARRASTPLLLVVLLLGIGIGYGTIDNRWYRVVAIEGQSMSPTMSPGDLAVFTRPDHFEVGDVAIFQVNGRVVTHRIIAIDAAGHYITQGDANPSPDRWDPESVEIVGAHLLHVPLLGTLFGAGVGAYLTDTDSAPVDVQASPSP